MSKQDMSQKRLDVARQKFKELQDLLTLFDEDNTTESSEFESESDAESDTGTIRDGATEGTSSPKVSNFFGTTLPEKKKVLDMMDDLSDQISKLKIKCFDRDNARKVLLERLSKSEIAFLMLYVVIFGTHLRGNSPSIDRLRNIMNKGQISNILSSRYDKEELTLHRVMLSYPEVVAMQIARSNNSFYISAEHNAKNVPRFYLFRTGGAIVPKIYLEQWKKWYVSFVHHVGLQGSYSQYIGMTEANRYSDKFIENLYRELLSVSKKGNTLSAIEIPRLNYYNSHSFLS